MSSWRPITCVWELTLACDARCLHCGSRAGKARKHELSTDEGLELIQQLAALGCEAVTLSGGEPLVRRDWPRLARGICDAGMRLELITNGLAVARQAARVAEAGFFAVTFSVDGPEAVHDRLRGVDGGLRRLLTGAASLRKRGVRLGAVTQVNRLNMGCLDEIHDRLVDNGFEGWQLQLTMAHGRAADSGDLCLPPARMPELEARLLKLQQRTTMFVQAADNVGYMSRQEPALRSGTGRADRCWTGCSAGLQVLGVTSDGRVRGCLSLPDSFDEGSLRQRSLAEIWNDPGAFSYSRAFGRELLSGPCDGCELGAVCRGGCTSLSVASAGVAHGNPYCLSRIERTKNKEQKTKEQRMMERGS